MNTDILFQRLLELMKQVAYYGHTLGVFGVDQETMLPQDAGPGRDEIVAFMAQKANEAFTQPEIEDVLGQLSNGTDDLTPDAVNLVKRIAQGYRRAKTIRPDLASAWAQTTSRAWRAWTEAKARSDFLLFLPHLREVLSLAKERASVLDPEAHPYDAIAAGFEPGMPMEEMKQILFPLREPLTKLVRRISRATPPDETCLKGFFLPDQQEKLSRVALGLMGFNFKSGCLIVVSGHPQTITVGPHDVRATTRIAVDDIKRGFFGSIHEMGHSLFVQGAHSTFDWLFLDPEGIPISMATHESQSRMYENLIGRSLDFWTFFYPFLQAIVPAFEEVPMETFWRAVNRSRPSLNRVEADEVTYCLHILLRFELELAMFSGELEPADLPAAWNTKMKEYLGVTPRTDAEGCLQDVHWSKGYFGYFPSYAIGNLMAAQIWERMREDEVPSVEIKSGNFLTIKAWLKGHVHKWGMAYTAPQLIKTLTGGPIDHEPYLTYLKEKYAQVYNF